MPLSQRLRRIAWTVLLDHALDGLRQGGVPPWPPGRWPRLKGRLEQYWLGPIWGTWGDQVADQERWPEAVKLLLYWAFGLIRPDHRTALGLDGVPDSAWVEQTAWRPLLAVASTSGLIPLPAFPRHYRRSPGESVLDTLSGLWAVGNSTTYRYVDKGRRFLIDALQAAQADAQRRWALRDLAFRQYCQGMSAPWHQAQADAQGQHGHAMDAAWHLVRGQFWLQLAELLQRRALELASDPEHAVLCQFSRRGSSDAHHRVPLSLAESFIWRCLGDIDSELACLQLALRSSELATGTMRSLYRSQALYALGYFYNARDPDRSIGFLEEAAQQSLLATMQVGPDEIAIAQSTYVITLALLAFVQLRRNNPQADTLLSSALSAAKECPQLGVDAQGMLLKAQAEEARCHDRLEEALRYRQQALLLYERSGDLQEVVETEVNLGLLLAQIGRTDEAKKSCTRIIEMAPTFTLRPEALLSAHGGIALAAMTDKEFEAALNHLHEASRLSQKFGLSRHHLAALTNIAEVHYLRYRDNGMPDDEQLGDYYVEQCRSLAMQLGLPERETRAQSLKRSTLNPQTAVHHLLPVETSAQPGEVAKIEALRAELALPRPPAQRARTHIALSQLYLRIAAKERDAGRGLMQTHGLSELEADIEALQQTWAHDGNLASQLSSRWREQVGDWLTDSQRKAVLERLLAEGNLSKSSYGEAAEVSPATASKHLGLLADKGLLEQQGRGPATRYVLPSGQHSGSRDGTAAAGSPDSVH